MSPPTDGSEGPENLCETVGPDYHTEGRFLQQQAFVHAEKVIAQADRAYGDLTGRYYGGMLEEYRCEDADVVLIAAGSVAGTVRVVVDTLREQGKTWA